MTYTYSYKCLLCKKPFKTTYPKPNSGIAICDKCKAKKKEEKEKRKMEKKPRQINNPKGFNEVKKNSKKEKVKAAVVERNPNLMNSNPEGFNRYNKNSNSLEPIKNQLQQFAKLSDIEQKELVADLGNRLYMLRKEIRPLLLRFGKFKAFYEAKHFGWDWSEDK